MTTGAECLTLYACSKCGEEKPAEEFGKNRSKRRGLDSGCKVCKAAASRRYREQNRARLAAASRRYRKENRTRLAEYHRRYYEENRERRLEVSRRYCEENRGHLAEYKRRYYEENPERTAEYARRRRALKHNAEGDHTAPEVWQMAEDQGHLCAYCETPLFGDWHVDHMLPLSRGGRNDWTNLAITCPTCNLRKHRKTVEEFIDTLVRVV